MKRYVMANGADGRADIVFEDDLEPHLSPSAIRDLWLNRETPADPSDRGDPVAGAAPSHEPPDGGAVFRMVVFAPREAASQITPEAMIDLHKSIQSVHVPSLDDLRTAKHPSMHKTDTLNYLVLLEGEIWALSEGRDVLMKPGDVMIQRGCMHGWRNDTDRPAILLGVLIDALPA